ncbi:MAG TPA: glycosyltransferase [Verrucomicrobiae bacterium]|nr:glycosyltransferase [Verrucomicrobiae bacterium]
MVNSLERGGSERQFVELAGSLKRAGTPVQLGCIQRIGPFIDELARSGFEDLREFGLGNSLYGLESLRCRWRLMRHLLKSEIAVAHSFDFYINLTLIPSAKLARVPVIGSQRQLGDLLTPAQNRAQLEMFRWCERVVCNSQAAADRLARAGLKTEKLAVIGNGLPSAAFEPAVPSIERQKGILRVGMIARMNIRAKNQSILLRAAAGLKRKFPEVEYLLVGDGPLRADLEKEAAELGVRSQVSFLGDRSDVRQILASLDVSVVPSASESLSNVMLESMAAGIPVVATSVGGNIELGSDGRAVLVPLNDEAALASGLEAVLSDGKLRDELACRARQFAERKFSLGRICQQYCELYYDVLSA